MILFRRRLRFLATAWILFQAATLSALVPRACCLAHQAVSAPASGCHDKAPAPHCPVPAGDEQPTCAMHDGHGHAQEAAPPASAPLHECALRGTCGGPAAALFALLSAHGVLAESVFTLAAFPLVGATLSSTDQLIPQFASPDAPPPRA